MRPEKILGEATKTLSQRGVDYDAPQGERSMEHAVAIFNTITGNKLTESEGWTFMLAVKLARAQRGKPKTDTYVDLAGYAALLAECDLLGRLSEAKGDESNTDSPE